jgi:transposase
LDRRQQLYLDHHRVHFSKATKQFITGNHIERVPHPPYSPDLALSDFWLFSHVKTWLVGRPSTSQNGCRRQSLRF